MYFVRKPDRKGVKRYVFVYEYRDGKVRSLPRSRTKHLDGEPDHNIEYWIKQEEEKRGIKAAENALELTDPKFKTLVDRYLDYLDRARGRDPQTIRGYRQVLTQYVIPFFLSHREINNDPNNWVQSAPHMLKHMQDEQLSRHTIRISNTALRGFWIWMGDEGITIHMGVHLRLRNPPGMGATRKAKLKASLEPDQVVKFAMDASRPFAARLMALVGYFFSLRPQELFALERKYFRAGKRVLELETAQVLQRHGLDHRLAYRIEWQRASGGRQKVPKEFSFGWVTCFRRQAAELLVSMLQSAEVPETGLIFPNTIDYIYRYWKKHGIWGYTLKDMRRASLTWLGHHTTLPGLEIQKIARHADFESTQIYLRRPDSEIPDTNEVLDLDA